MLLTYRVGFYEAQLQVSDNLNTGITTTTRITAVPVGSDNQRPIADAGPDQTVVLGGQVILDGSRSRDPDGNAVSFQWMVISRPSFSQATPSDPATMNPIFQPDSKGSYEVELKVSDGQEESAPNTVRIRAEEVDDQE